jgi:chemotaxis protein MotA
MRLGALLGFALALGAVIGAGALEGGALSVLFQASAMLVVLGGSCGAVLVQVGFARFRESVQAAVWLVRPPRRDEETAIAQLVSLAQRVRREGVLSLEKLVWAPEVAALPPPAARRHVVLGLQAITDGIRADRVKTIMESAMRVKQERLAGMAAAWESAGGYAPTFGIVGAVLGLVHVMQNLSTPGGLGPGIAQAFVSTLYGLGFANVVCLPVAARLADEAEREYVFDEMLMHGVCSIAAGENDLHLQARMQAFRSEMQ